MPASRRPGERIPLFVTYYSCAGYLRGGLGDEWPLLPLASSGIAALCVNYYRPSRVNRDAAVDYDIGRVSVERSEEHTSELQSLMRISYAVFCLKKTKTT